MDVKGVDTTPLKSLGPGLAPGWTPPDNKSQFYTGDVPAIWKTQDQAKTPSETIPLVQNVQSPAQNYVDAFDPQHPRVSVANDNASIKEALDINALISTPPQAIASDLTFIVPTGILALIFLL